jgi:hypothetical protein
MFGPAIFTMPLCNRTSLNFETFCLFVWGRRVQRRYRRGKHRYAGRGVKIHLCLDRFNFYYYINVCKRYLAVIL